MEELKPLLEQLKEADAAGDATKASALAEQIRTIQNAQAGAGSPTVAPATPSAPPVDPAMREALDALKEADATAANDPYEASRADAIGRSIAQGKPKGYKKADFSNLPVIPEFKYNPVISIDPNPTIPFQNDLGGGMFPIETTPQTYTSFSEDDLRNDPVWLTANRTMFKAMNGYEFDGTDDELHSYGLQISSALRNNEIDAGLFLYKFRNADKRILQAAIYNVDAGQSVDTTVANTTRAGYYMMKSPLNLVTLFGGAEALAAAKQLAPKVANPIAFRTLLKRALLNSADNAVMAGVSSGSLDATQQGIRMGAGYQEAFSLGQSALSTLAGMGGGAALSVMGSAIGTLASKEGRAVVSNWMQGIEGYKIKVVTDEGEKLLQDVTPREWQKMADDARVPQVKVATEDGEKLISEVTQEDWQKMFDASGQDPNAFSVRVLTDDGEKLQANMTEEDWQKLADQYGWQTKTDYGELPLPEDWRSGYVDPNTGREVIDQPWRERTDYGNLPLPEGWRSAYIDPNTGAEVFDPPTNTWKTKVIDANGNESAADVIPGDNRSQYVNGPPRAASDMSPTDRRNAWIEGARNKEAFDKIMNEAEQARDTKRTTREPIDGSSDPGVTDAMAKGGKQEVSKGLSEITKIILREDFKKVPNTHAEAAGVVRRIVDPIIEVFKRGDEEEIGDVLLDPTKSNAWHSISNALTVTMSHIGASLRKAEEKLKLFEGKLQNSKKGISTSDVAKMDKLRAERDQWLELAMKVEPTYKKVGSFAGILLNHRRIVEEGIGAAARRTGFNSMRAAGYSNDEIVAAFIQGIEMARDSRNMPKGYRDTKREFFLAMKNGDITKAQRLGETLAKLELKYSKSKTKEYTTWFDKLTRGLMEYYTNSLLSNPKTLEINALTSWVEHALRPVFSIAGNPFSAQAWRRAAAIRQATRATRRDAMKAAYSALMEDMTNQGSRYADYEHHVIPGVAGKTIRVPMRVMAMTDTYISHRAYMNEVAAMATDQFAETHAKEVDRLKGLIKNADKKAKPKLEERLKTLEDSFDNRLESFIDKKIKDAVDEKGQFTDAAAATVAEDVLFKKEFNRGRLLEGIWARGEDALRAVPLLRIFIPFYRTPIRVIEGGIKYTPGVNLMNKTFRDDLFGANGLYARDVARGKMMFSTAVMLTTVAAAQSGMISGNGPLDPNAKKAMMDAGWRPNRLWLPGMDKNNMDQWFDYSRLDPIAFPMKLIATMFEKHRMYSEQVENGAIPPEEANAYRDYALMATVSFAQAVKDINMLQGINKVFTMWETLQENEEWGIKQDAVGKEFASILQGFVPNVARKVGDMIDPYTVDPQTYEDIFKAAIPGLKEGVNLQYTVLGKARVKGSPIEGFFWSPIGLGNGVPKTNEQYVYEQLGLMEYVTGKTFRLGYTHPDYAGLDLRTIKTADGKMSLYDKWNRMISNVTYNGKTLEQALYDDLKTTEKIGMMGAGNQRYISDREKQINKTLSFYRKLAWDVGMDEEVKTNADLIKRKTYLDQLKEQANQPQELLPQNYFGMPL